MLKEFKEFAMKGNVVDLAVGVIIGGAFGKIVSSLVGDIIMPVLGLIIGKIDFTRLKYHTINYGTFIQNVVDFLIISFSIFLVIKAINKIKFKKEKAEEIAEVLPSKEEVLLTEIRDLLIKNAEKDQ